ncbi:MULTISPECIES: EAL domain-containing protein [Ralstonia]|uniref:Diguanylate cyclase/phosphodiesterase n=1 Tax=Ralstonia pickettii OR214 TaxID=1264675 RepID=R0E297_RALPI|nr:MULTISPECIES: EAL domain-containing protein [Ralstonia]ENZ76264.1 diguanylate cyclase/phosphodiesterase [Ralstonia pickettii OR214]MCM3582851.1 EAL domain-containing protein [Ralstonia pickettii]OYU21550.1 MAG: diguanylate cyclase [Ralstonia sp. PBBBR1]
MTVSVAECMEKQLLRVVFQPIGTLSSGEVLGYEALTRGPAGSRLESPQALFEQAQREHCMVALERFMARLSVSTFTKAQLPGKLFLNLSAAAIREIACDKDNVWAFLGAMQFPHERIVIELTEQACPNPLSSLQDALRLIRQAGAQLALDDYGTGNANLSLWIGLRPDYVKVDRSIADCVSKSPFRQEVLRSLHSIAKAGHAQLIAEGLENREDLAVCRNLGINHVQGFLLGKPSEMPELTWPVQDAFRTNFVPPAPDANQDAPRAFSASRLLLNAPSVSPNTRNDDVLSLFARHPNLHALAVVENGRPVGLISRHAFVDAYAFPYRRELHGRKTCMEFANQTPVVVEQGATMEQLMSLLKLGDQRYLSEGLVIVNQGQYVGLATGEDLVRAVTEARIEAARYANPLTFLPGNIPIDIHMNRLLESDVPFHACYCDLNSFKPFNDVYGYWQGDKMIKLAAETLAEACDRQSDFLGHIGGDDFFILFQSPDWEARIRTAMAQFDASAVGLYTPADIKAGGIQSEDRHGNLRFYNFVTIAAGVVPVQAGAAIDTSVIATQAAAAKRQAKRAGEKFFVCREPFAVVACC